MSKKKGEFFEEHSNPRLILPNAHPEKIVPSDREPQCIAVFVEELIDCGLTREEAKEALSSKKIDRRLQSA